MGRKILHSSMFLFNGNAPLNLAMLLNFYNTFGFFPIYIDKYGQIFINTKKTSQLLLIIGSILSMAFNMSAIYKHLDVWKTSNPASLLETVLAMVWTISCVNYSQVVVMKSDKILNFFNTMKEVSLLFTHHHSQSRADYCTLIGLLAIFWIIPIVIMVIELYIKFSTTYPPVLEKNEFKCLSEFVEDYKLSSIVVCARYFWIFILEPFSSLVLYTIESIPLILSYCLWDICKGFSKLVHHHQKCINGNVSKGISEISNAYTKLKEISSLQNEVFGTLIWTNVASSVLYTAQTVTAITIVQENYFNAVKTLNIIYVLIMTLLSLYVGAEIINKVQSMKGWLAEESVLEKISSNRLTLLLNELSINAVGIKGGSYFTMTHQFLLNVIGTIITYFIVIYQFKPKENHQN